MRVEGWEQLLDRFLAESQSIAFQWGEMDCALWCGDWVARCTGEDHTATFRGTYTTDIGAAQRLIDEGFADLPALFDYYLTPVAVEFAQRGDIVWLDQGAAGIVAGRHAFFLTQDAGLAPGPLTSCTKAWRV